MSAISAVHRGEDNDGDSFVSLYLATSHDFKLYYDGPTSENSEAIEDLISMVGQ